VPLIVLVGVHLVFGSAAGAEILLALCADADPAAGSDRRHRGGRAELVILTAGIDLSVGAIMVLSSVVMGQFAFRYGLPPGIAVLPASPAAHSAAFINGFLVAA
jgi:fructose transport system permease protein